MSAYGDRRHDRYLAPERYDRYDHCRRSEADRSDLASAVDTCFLRRFKPCDWNILRLGRKCRCRDDGDWKCDGNQSWNGGRCSHLRCHVRGQVKPALRYDESCPGCCGREAQRSRAVHVVDNAANLCDQPGPVCHSRDQSDLRRI